MPQYDVGIGIAATEDLSGITAARSAIDDFNKTSTAGFKQTRSAVDDLSKGGIAGIERLKEQVIDLQRSNVAARQAVILNREAQNQLNLSLKNGTITATQHGQMLAQIQQREVELNKAAQQASYAFRTGSQELSSFNRSQQQASEVANLFAQTLGVRVPDGIGRLLTRLPALQGALTGAFQVGVVTAFAVGTADAALKVGVALEAMIRGYAELSDHAHAAREGMLAAVGEDVREKTLGFFNQIRASMGLEIIETDKMLRRHQELARSAAGEATLKIQREAVLTPLQGAGRIRAELGFQLKDIGGLVSPEFDAERTAARALAGAKELEDRRKIETELTGLQQQAIADRLIGRQKEFAQINVEENKALVSLRERLVHQALDQKQYNDLVNAQTELGRSKRAAINAKYDKEENDMLAEMRHQGLESLQKYEDERLKKEKDADLKHAELIQRVSELDQQALEGRGNKYAAQLAQITFEQKRQFDQLWKMYGQDEKNWAALQQAKSDLAQIAAEKQKQVVESYGRELESIYDRITGGAKNASDILKNIWKEYAQYEKDQFFNGLAGVLLGRGPGQLGTGQAGGGARTGGLAGPASVIFGGSTAAAGGAFGSGIITNAFPGGNSFLDNSPGFISTGITGGGTPPFIGAYGVPGTYNRDGAYTVAPGDRGLPPGTYGSDTGLGVGGGAGAVVLAPTTQLGKILQTLSHAAPADKFAMGLGLAGVSMFNDNSTLGSIGRAASAGTFGYGLGHALGMSTGNSLLTGLGLAGVSAGRSIGHLGGALIGAAGGALTGFEIGAMFGGPLGGAIGAAAGAIVGGLVALFGGDPRKKHDTQIQQQYEQQMFATLEDYKHFRVDYLSATQAEQKDFSDMTAQFQRPESKIIPQTELTNILKNMADIEDERNRRRQFLSLQPVPEFATGGPIPGSFGMPVPIVAHGGEFMMTSQAVNRIGMTVLQGLNSAGGSGSAGASTGEGYSMTVWVASRELAAQIVEKGLPVVINRGGSAKRALGR